MGFKSSDAGSAAVIDQYTNLIIMGTQRADQSKIPIQTAVRNQVPSLLQARFPSSYSHQSNQQRPATSVT